MPIFLASPGQESTCRESLPKHCLSVASWGTGAWAFLFRASLFYHPNSHTRHGRATSSEAQSPLDPVTLT